MMRAALISRTFVSTIRRVQVPKTVVSRGISNQHYARVTGFSPLPAFKQFPRHFSVVDVPLESLGDSITSAVIVEWQKKAGDSIAEDDVIAVVETDKVTMDIRAKGAGVFVEGYTEAGGELEIGAPLYKMDTDAAATPAAKWSTESSSESSVSDSPAPASEASSAASGARHEIPVPSMGESITQGVLAEWTVEVGSVVNADDILARIDTDKVTVDVHSPFSGTVVELRAAEGDEVDVGAPLFVLEEGAGKTETKSSTSAAPATAEKTAAPAEKAAANTPAKPVATPAPAGSSAAPARNNRGETRVKMTRMRQRIAQRLKEAQNTAAMLTTFQEVDMGPLMDMRKMHKEEFEKKHGVKLGFMSAFVKASAAALQEIPAINAVIDDETKEIVYHDYCDISVAVASPTGLVVPVLRNCEQMSFADVEKTIGMFGKKAKEGQMALEDMAGGTFTISNGGVFGSLYGTPIINPPQSAILGMHATKMRAVVVNGKVEARPMMYLALTYDHRLIDGREAVTFLKSLQGKIEDPSRLLLDI